MSSPELGGGGGSKMAPSSSPPASGLGGRGAGWMGEREEDEGEQERDAYVGGEEEEQEEEIHFGRRELESDSSEYQPSEHSSASLAARQAEDAHIPEEDVAFGEAAKKKAKLKVVSRPSPRKRRASSISGGPSARTGPGPGIPYPYSYYEGGSEDEEEEVYRSLHPPPLKRIKGPFSRAYLALLNTDIEDAAARYITPPSDHPPLPLPESQVGLTVWTPPEKELFYEALARLGRGDAVGIAARMGGTKSALEVRQYLRLLRTAAAARKLESRARSTSTSGRGEPEGLSAAEVPAALEVGGACCDALERAADALALRQERWEEACEARRWRDGRGEGEEAEEGDWLVSRDNWRELSERRAGASAPSLGLFYAGNWLKLSERLFMNSMDDPHHEATEKEEEEEEDEEYGENNWRSVSEDPPAIRLTTLEDFRALAVSLTRRLVATTLYVAASRLRAKRVSQPWLHGVVRRRDVEAAVASLGPLIGRSAGGGDRDAFWAGCARRLRLRVCDDEVEGGGGEARILSYDDVERALSGRGGNGSGKPTTAAAAVEDSEGSVSDIADIMIKKEPASGDEDTSVDADDEGEEELEEGHLEDDEDDDGPAPAPITDPNVKAEADEVVHFSALGFPPTTRARRALARAIEASRTEEAYADALDRRASRAEEARLWQLLGGRGSPDEGGEDGEQEEEEQEELPIKAEVEDDGEMLRPPPVYRGPALEDVHPVGRGWREKLRYVSEWEWEVAAAEVEEGECEKEKDRK